MSSRFCSCCSSAQVRSLKPKIQFQSLWVGWGLFFLSACLSPCSELRKTVSFYTPRSTTTTTRNSRATSVAATTTSAPRKKSIFKGPSLFLFFTYKSCFATIRLMMLFCKAKGGTTYRGRQNSTRKIPFLPFDRRRRDPHRHQLWKCQSSSLCLSDVRFRSHSKPRDDSSPRGSLTPLLLHPPEPQIRSAAATSKTAPISCPWSTLPKWYTQNLLSEMTTLRL